MFTKLEVEFISSQFLRFFLHCLDSCTRKIIPKCDVECGKKLPIKRSMTCHESQQSKSENWRPSSAHIIIIHIKYRYTQTWHPPTTVAQWLWYFHMWVVSERDSAQGFENYIHTGRSPLLATFSLLFLPKREGRENTLCRRKRPWATTKSPFEQRTFAGKPDRGFCLPSSFLVWTTFHCGMRAHEHIKKKNVARTQ